MGFKILIIFACVLLYNNCHGSIKNVNDTEYSKMPPVFKMDLYEDCLLKPNGVYCMADFTLVADDKSDLLNFIEDYSSNKRMHFNHTRLRHGICVSQKCRQFLLEKKGEDLKTILEGCLNETYGKTYKLKTRISEPFTCNTDEKKNILDAGDIIVAIVCLIIVLCNVVGSLFDYFAEQKGIKKNKILMCFSIRRNINKLLDPYEHLGENEKRFKALHGLRVLSMFCTILLHATMPLVTMPENPHFIEQMYGSVLNYIILNGTLIVQTFFIMSGFLMAYKIEMYAAKHEITWKMIPVGILLSYIRLTPSYALVTLLSMTWLRFCGSGPLWQMAVIGEVDACRNYGWTNLLYISNYLDYNSCMGHTWYIAANFQLFILGYIVCVLARSPFAKKVTLGSLFVAGIVLPVIITYYKNLDAVMLMTPELINNINGNPTFNYVYKRAHTNIPNFILGIGLGYYTYHCHKYQVDTEKYKKYRFLFMLMLPAFIGIMFLGILFTNEMVVSPYAKALYSGFIKPIFGLCICMIIFGSIFKIEFLYRSILEWNGWQVPAKLTYSAYVIHMQLIRAMTGIGTSVHSIDYFHMLQVCFGTIILSYIITVPFWLIVEGPLIELLRLPLVRNKPNENETGSNNLHKA